MAEEPLGTNSPTPHKPPAPLSNTTDEKEPINPFYWLLLVGGVAFVITVMGVTFVPILEEKARDAGREVPQSDFRDSLRKDGYLWVLYEVAFIVVMGLASMGLDRLRRLKKERASGKILSSQQESGFPKDHLNSPEQTSPSGSLTNEAGSKTTTTSQQEPEQLE